MPSEEGKEVIKVEVKVDISKEFDSKTWKWVESVPDLKKKFEDIQWKGQARVDPRKWDKRKLADEIEGPAVYAAKLLSMEAMPIAKDAAKGKDVEKGIGGLLKSYDKKMKEVDAALEKALEDIEADKGNNRKALRDGKKALDKLAGLDFKGLFGDPSTQVSAAFKTLGKALSDAKGERRAEEAAYKAVTAALDKARDAFASEADDIEAGIVYLQNTAGNIKKAKDVGPNLVKFADNVQDADGEFKKLLKSIDAYRVDINDAYNDASSKGMTEKDTDRRVDEFNKYHSLDKDAKVVAGIVQSLAKEFKQVERDLK